jgi:hypothetical protein
VTIPKIRLESKMRSLGTRKLAELDEAPSFALGMA